MTESDAYRVATPTESARIAIKDIHRALLELNDAPNPHAIAHVVSYLGSALIWLRVFEDSDPNEHVIASERERIAGSIEAFFPDPHAEGENCEDCIIIHEAAKIARAGGR